MSRNETKQNVSFRGSEALAPRSRSARTGEQGYSLVAALAVMSIMALLLITAAPSVRQQTQRSLEEEAIWRGEEIVQAIKDYVRLTGRMPTSMQELLDGASRGAKKVQVLRAVAAIDPLSSSGEWRLIRRTDPAFLEFQRALVAFAGRQLSTSDPAFAQLAGGIPIPIQNVLDIESSEEAPGGEDTTQNSSGPFIGVASRSRRASVITYYGIERHDKWIFTPFFR